VASMNARSAGRPSRHDVNATDRAAEARVAGLVTRRARPIFDARGQQRCVGLSDLSAASAESPSRAVPGLLLALIADGTSGGRVFPCRPRGARALGIARCM